MRYKTLIVDKLIAVTNGLKQLRFHFEKGELQQYRQKEVLIQEIIEEIQTLINTQNENYN